MRRTLFQPGFALAAARTLYSRAGQVGVALVVLGLSITVSYGATVIAPYLEVASGTGVPGTGGRIDSSLTGSGYDFVVGSADANVRVKFWGNPTSGNGIWEHADIGVDFRQADLPLGDLRIRRINASNGLFLPTLPYDMDSPSQAFTTTFDADTGSGFQVLENVDTLTIVNAAGGSSQVYHGFSPDVLSWFLYQNNEGTSVNPVQPDNPTGNKSATAIGLIWNDLNSNTQYDSGDTVTVRWAVTADTFAEMDTVAELNAAVIPEPASLVLLGLGGLLLLGCRRHA